MKRKMEQRETQVEESDWKKKQIRIAQGNKGREKGKEEKEWRIAILKGLFQDGVN